MSAVLVASVATFGGAAVGFSPALRDRAPSWLGPALFGLGFVLVTVLIGDRWVEAGRPPFKTRYESLLLLAWCTAGLFLLLQLRHRVRLLGLGAALVAGVALAAAAARPDLEIPNLPPALQSPWFVPHVAVYFMGYAAMFLAAVAAAVSLVAPTATVEVQRGGEARDVRYADLMHTAVVVGFPLITVGMVLGGVWARQAWGDYWAWDPKENLALVCWLVYALYFHVRRLPGWGGSRSAWMVLAGAACLIFTYLFMHLLPTAEASAHVYQ